MFVGYSEQDDFFRYTRTWNGCSIERVLKIVTCKDLRTYSFDTEQFEPSQGCIEVDHARRVIDLFDGMRRRSFL